MKKKILAGIFAGLMALNIFSDVNAATRAEIAAINVKRPADFNYWEKNSSVKNQIVNYVKDVTNKNSKNFIPVEDRIAVFDMDGTFYCETAPEATGYMFVLSTILKNPPPTITQEYRDKAKIWFEDILKKNIDEDFKKYSWTIYEGMTDEELETRLKHFMTTQNVYGLSNLKYGESFYLPMVEMISYLKANNFTVYVITGSHVTLARILCNDAVDVQPNNIIGAYIPYTFENNVGEKYFVKGDRLLLSGNSAGSNTHINKIYSIKREIGKRPVLAFGNSMGDADMLNYILADNKYKSAAFVVICDDFHRELGNQKLADTMLSAAQKNNWKTISMKNDWKTIYGDNVKLVQ